jgi:hypothetical protein
MAGSVGTLQIQSISPGIFRTASRANSFDFRSVCRTAPILLESALRGFVMGIVVLVMGAVDPEFFISTPFFISTCEHAWA